jgi:phage regulator Rha-like protein
MNILTQSKATKMTSQQMAKLCEKRHDSVKRTIETLMDKGVISYPQTVIGIKAANGIAPLHYVFEGEQGRIDSIIVVAQLSPEFTAALVKRWDELERGAAPAMQIPQSFADALQLAADQAKQLELAAPKVSAYDKLIESTHLKSVGDVAKSIGLRSAQALNKKLEAVRAYDGRCGNRVWSGWFVEQGLGEMRTTDEGYSSNKMTAKGQAWALNLFGGNE